MTLYFYIPVKKTLSTKNLNEKSHESSARTGIEGFLKVPRVKSTVDPLHWWSTNKFQAILHHVVLNKFVIVGN